MKACLTYPINNSQLAIHHSQLPSDAYGGVLSSTLTPELEVALSGQGAITDIATGLVHLGQGRFYDPSLGRPLQPNPMVIAPTVPQVLNRYSATPVGPPGVAEVTAGDAFNWTSHAIGLAKNLTVELAGQIPVRTGYHYAGQITFNIIASNGRLAKDFTVTTTSGRNILAEMSALLYPHRNGEILANLTTAGEGKLLTEAVKKRTGLLARWPEARIITDWELRNTQSVPLNGVLDDLSIFKVAKTGFAFGLDAVIGGGVQYLDDLGNPYLGRDQRLVRAGISGTGGATFAAIATLACIGSEGILCPVVAGSVGGLLWVPIQDTAFNLANRFTSQFGYSILPQRNLKPLRE